MVLPFLKNDYTKWSMVVLFGSLFASFLNYAFTLIMGRMLSPSFFGEVSTIFGLMVIIITPTQAISNYVSRHISFLAGLRHAEASGYGPAEAGKKDYFSARVWLRKISRPIFLLSLVMLFFFWLSIPLLSRFLGINPLPFFVFSFVIPFSFMLSIHTGALQGLKSFNAFSFQGVLGAALKLFLAVIFVYIGLFVPGVMLALVVSLTVLYFYNYAKIKSFWKNLNLNSTTVAREKPYGAGIVVKNIFSKSFLTVFLAALLIALISNIDVVLAKHFFEPGLAGEYAALSAVGKILIYVASAFVTVMFAVVSESFTNKSLTLKTFKNTLTYISAISLPAVIVFGFAPKTVIGIFFGATYIKIAPYLPIFSVAMFLFSISIAFIHYFLATRNNSFLLPFAAGVLLQIILISLYHGSIQNIVMSVLWSSIFLLLALIANHFFYGNIKIKTL